MNNDITLFERNQQRRTLTIILLTALIVSAGLGVFDIQFRTWTSVDALFALSLSCIPILLINLMGRIRTAALLFSLMLLVVISLNLYDGDGVHDPGILALPIFIMGGTMVFGRKSAPYFALSAIGALTAIVYLEVSRTIRPAIGPTTFGILVPLITLLLAATVVVWVIVTNVEGDLTRAKGSESELRRSYDLTLGAWAKILEYRDRETKGHTERVTELAMQLASRLGLGGQSLEDFRRGALLHDIGKLGIPDAILLKPTELTAEEWVLMKEHPAFAHDVLEPIPYLERALDIPWCHHEKWDGTGYPRGLRGSQIPIAARIFAVVDIWDALTSDRPYRKAWPEDRTLAHIRSLAGSHLDPDVVHAFLTFVAPEPGMRA